MKKVLMNLMSDIQVSGGLIEYGNGTCAPLADPTWIDLGETILNAKKVLELDGERVELDIIDVSDKYQTCDDYI